MDFLYFLVTGSNAYNDGYGFHENFFISQAACTTGFFYSAVIGFVLALIFYFTFCNNKSIELAKPAYWWIFWVLAMVAAYFIGDLFIIGAQGSSGTFYDANMQHFNAYAAQHLNNQQAVADCQNTYQNITNALNQGNDVAFEFNVTNAVISMVIFSITSFLVRKFTKHGGNIPF